VVRNGIITVQDVKKILTYKQFYRGEIDGKVDVAYHKAVAEFQKSESIAQDGLVGSDTYAKLQAAWPRLLSQTSRAAKITELGVKGPAPE
jgi:peptidoglycan hydrolase-like protein with peptidoglycan-binding domain